MASPGTIEILAHELGLALVPLEAQLGAGAYDLFESLGLRPPAGFVTASQLAAALGQGVTAAGRLPAQVEALAAAITAGQLAGLATASAALMATIRDVVQAIAAVGTATSAVGASLGGLGAADRATVQAFAAELPARVMNRVVVDYLEARSSQLAGALVVAGLIERERAPGDPTNPLLPPYQRTVVRFDRLVQLVTHPDQYLADVYRWGATEFDGLALFHALRDFLRQQLHLPAMVLAPAGLAPSLDAFFFALRLDPRPAPAPPGLVLDLRFPAVQDFQHSYPFAAAWQLELDAHARFASDTSARITAPLHLDFTPPSGTIELAISAAIHRLAEAGPLVLLGQAGGSRLEIAEPRVALGVAASVTATGATVEPTVAGALDHGKLVISGQGSDGLLRELLGGVDLEADFALDFTWSPSHGLQLAGSAGLAIDLPVSRQLGPIRIDALHLGATLIDAGVELELAATLAARLGPLTATVKQVGARGVLTFPGHGGNLGPAQLDFRFKPPTGVGLALDAPMVKLAGFLDVDEANHQYAGGVELRIADTLELTAIGIVNTRLPDGSDGFSLVFLIDTVFPTPIPLGFNFYLAGVGGLLGLHRTVDLDRLRDGIRDGSARNLLFPTDVVANMAAIVRQLGGVFPAKRDQFVVAPLARITWSSPPLLVIDLGLILEFANPVRVAVVGNLRAAVPDPDDPIVDIKVAFLGAIDLQLGMLSFDASIYDSYLGRGGFKLAFEGDIAVRFSWGKQKDFLASVGGFHPAYTAPAYLRVPKLKRISVSLLKDNPRLKLTSYFALTTNTVQFGAELDFYFHVSHFNIVGDFGFDVLFQWSPFRFAAAVRAHLAVRAGNTDLLSLRLAFELQGTTPWHAQGKASFGILFWTISVKFDKTWGEQVELSLPAVAVLPAALDEFRRDLNWKAALSATATQLVQLFPTTGLVIDAAGVLEISQPLVPLGARLALFNNAAPSDISRLDVHALRIAGTLVTPQDVTGEFAPAAFRELGDDDKLAAASYEAMKSGVAASASDGLVADYLLGRPVTYERIVDDGAPARGTVAASLATFAPLVRGGSVGSSPLAKQAAVLRQRNSVRDVAVADERFTVVSTASLRAVDAASHALSRSQAQARLGDLLASGHRATDLDIIPAYRAAS